MPRKATTNFDDYETDVIRQMQNILKTTTLEERTSNLEIWCSGNHDWVTIICNERNISPIVFIFTALFESMHPLIIASETELRWTITGCLVRIMQVVTNGEVVHIPLCTTQEQPAVVHIPNSEKVKSTQWLV